MIKSDAMKKLSRLSYMSRVQWILVSIALILTLSLGACGDDGFDTKSVLKTYRVLAIKSEPPALTLSEPTEITLYDFHPEDLKSTGRPTVEYEWTLCPFSLGSVTQYECIFDEVSLDSLVQNIMASDNDSDDDDTMGRRPRPSSTLKMTATDLLDLLGDDLQMQMEQLEMGADMLGSEMSFFDAGQINLFIKLKVNVDNEPDFTAVKVIPLILSADLEVNQNPVLMGMYSEQLVPEVQVAEEVKLEALFSDSVAEVYTPPLSAEAEAQNQEATQETENLLFSWYTTSGTFDKPVRLAEDTSTLLTVGEDIGPQRLYLTLRDGRGGVDLRVIDFKVAP